MEPPLTTPHLADVSGPIEVLLLGALCAAVAELRLPATAGEKPRLTLAQFAHALAALSACALLGHLTKRARIERREDVHAVGRECGAVDVLEGEHKLG